MKKAVIFAHDCGLSGANLSLLDYLKDVDPGFYKIVVVIPRRKGEFSKRINQLGFEFVICKYFSIFKYLYHISLRKRIKCLLKRAYNLIHLRKEKHKLVEFISEFKADCIISNSFSTLLGCEIAKTIGIKHIFHIREFMDLDHKITYSDSKKVYDLVDGSDAIYISRSIRDYYFRKYHFRRSTIIYNSIKKWDFIKSRTLFENQIINILIAGNLQDNKGQDDAINSIRILKSKSIRCNLYICGSGPNSSLLKKMIHDNNLDNVYLTGQLSSEELIELRKQIDISLVCSKCEALGRVTVESMYYKSLTIGANSGETANLLSDNRGLLYEPGNSLDLALKILYAFENKLECEKIINNAYIYANNTFNVKISDKVLSFAFDN